MSSKNTLYDFILQFERALARPKHRELKADYESINKKPKCKLNLAEEKQINGINLYKKSFYKFQNELMMVMNYQTNLVKY